MSSPDPKIPLRLPNSTMGAQAWGPLVGREDLDTGANLTPRNSGITPTSASADSRTIIVNDIGDSRQLADAASGDLGTPNIPSQDVAASSINEPELRPTLERAETDKLVTGTGDSFASQGPCGHLPPGLAIDREDSAATQISCDCLAPANTSFDSDGSTPLTSQGSHLVQSPVQLELNQGHDLSYELRRAMLLSAGTGRDFLPYDQLDRIITKNNVRAELGRHKAFQGWSSEALEKMSSAIRDMTMLPQPGRTKEKATTRRKLFAILVSFNRVPTIHDMIHQDLYDTHLPFFHHTDRVPGGVRTSVYWKDVANQRHYLPDEMFESWGIHEFEYLTNNQWRFMSPYFQISNDRPDIYDLPDLTILPFVKKHHVETRGGQGGVYRVSLHPAHIDLVLPPGEDPPPYAVKKLHQILDKEAEMKVTEVEAQTELARLQHGYLSRLLLTYRQGGEYHLVSRWADGNLLDFWKREHLQPGALKRNRRFALWFVHQIWGISSGLAAIYQAKTDDEGVNPQHRNGRHADIKPENLLWFENDDALNPDDRQRLDDAWGTFKINDFGLTAFHRKVTEMVNANDQGHTPTYRGPEFDVQELVDASCDVWAWGCTLLEFITWYLCGWAGVDTFSSKRLSDDSGRLIGEDKFFNYAKTAEKGKPIATHKQSVVDAFNTLRDHEDCFDFMADLLDYIQDKLLRLHPSDRESCVNIEATLKNMFKDMQRDEAYCTEKKKSRPHRNLTDMSTMGISTRKLRCYRACDVAGPEVPEASASKRDSENALGDRALTAQAPTLLTLHPPPSRSRATTVGSLTTAEDAAAEGPTPPRQHLGFKPEDPMNLGDAKSNGTPAQVPLAPEDEESAEVSSPLLDYIKKLLRLFCFGTRF